MGKFSTEMGTEKKEKKRRKLSTNEEEIFRRLQVIGSEAAAFFRDACLLLHEVPR